MGKSAADILKDNKFVLELLKHKELQKDNFGKIKTSSWIKIWHVKLLSSTKWVSLTQRATSPIAKLIFFSLIIYCDEEGCFQGTLNDIKVSFIGGHVRGLSKAILEHNILLLKEVGLIDIREVI